MTAHQERTEPLTLNVSAAMQALGHVEHVHDGDWIDPTPQEGHRLICCDCGLVHRVDFRVEDGRAQFRATRDDAETAAWRAANPVAEVTIEEASGSIDFGGHSTKEILDDLRGAPARAAEQEEKRAPTWRERQLYAALCDLQNEPNCWCDAGEGGPIHSPACAYARDVERAVRGEIDVDTAAPARVAHRDREGRLVYGEYSAPARAAEWQRLHVLALEAAKNYHANALMAGGWNTGHVDDGTVSMGFGECPHPDCALVRLPPCALTGKESKS